MLELGRGLGQLMKSGWQPRRSIILASWDAEEQGLIGSTEWAEENAAELKEKSCGLFECGRRGLRAEL